MNLRKTALVTAVAMVFFGTQVGAQQVTGTLGSPSATTSHQREATPRTRPEVRRRDQE